MISILLLTNRFKIMFIFPYIFNISVNVFYFSVQISFLIFTLDRAKMLSYYCSATNLSSLLPPTGLRPGQCGSEATHVSSVVSHSSTLLPPHGSLRSKNPLRGLRGPRSPKPSWNPPLCSSASLRRERISRSPLDSSISSLRSGSCL